MCMFAVRGACGSRSFDSNVAKEKSQGSLGKGTRATLQSSFPTYQTLLQPPFPHQRPTLPSIHHCLWVSTWVSAMNPEQAGPKETSTETCLHLPWHWGPCGALVGSTHRGSTDERRARQAEPYSGWPPRARPSSSRTQLTLGSRSKKL